MPDNPNQITIDNSVVVLVDHQPWVAFSVKSIDAGLLVNNLAGLAASAKALDVPTILTTVGAEGSVLKDPLLNGLAEVLPDVTAIDRVSTNAWEDIRDAARASRRDAHQLGGGPLRVDSRLHERRTEPRHPGRHEIRLDGRRLDGIPGCPDRRRCSGRLTKRTDGNHQDPVTTPHLGRGDRVWKRRGP